MVRLMAWPLAAVVGLSALAGCGEPLFDDANDATTTQVPSSEGQTTPEVSAQPETSPESPPTQPSAEPTAPPPQPVAETTERKGVFGKTTADVVKADEYLELPNIEVADGKIEGYDPFSQAASSYFVLSAKASTLGLQQAVNLHKAEHDRPPTYDEFMDMMRQHRVEFRQLRSYEKYGYDEKRGTIMVLIDTEARDNR